MKTLYLDIFSGISGDMFIGALIDLGLDAKRLEQELEKLGLEGYHLHVTRGRKASIEGVKFDVHLAHEHDHEHEHTGKGTDLGGHSPHHHDHEHEHQGPHGGQMVKTSKGEVELSVFEANVPPRFRLYFRDLKGKKVPPAAPAAVRLETVRPDGAHQSFKFKPQDDFLEATRELPEPHEFTAILKLKSGNQTETHQIDFV